METFECLIVYLLILRHVICHSKLVKLRKLFLCFGKSQQIEHCHKDQVTQEIENISYGKVKGIYMES